MRGKAKLGPLLEQSRDTMWSHGVSQGSMLHMGTRPASAALQKEQQCDHPTDGLPHEKGVNQEVGLFLPKRP